MMRLCEWNPDCETHERRKKTQTKTRLSKKMRTKYTKYSKIRPCPLAHIILTSRGKFPCIWTAIVRVSGSSSLGPWLIRVGMVNRSSLPNISRHRGYIEVSMENIKWLSICCRVIYRPTDSITGKWSPWPLLQVDISNSWSAKAGAPAWLWSEARCPPFPPAAKLRR